MKQAIVTGAGHGLGAAIAARAAGEGYRVGVMDIDEGRAAKVAASLEGAVALQADVTDQASVRAAFDAFSETPDLVVNNAGIVRFGPFLEQSVEDLRAVIEINLMGVCISAQEAGRRMVARGRGGCIVNISSINGIHPAPDVGTYPASKAAVARLSENLALEWGQYGIRVNTVAPGFIDAGMSKPIYENPRTREVRGGGVPLKRLGEAEDVAAAVMFLASDEASYITGQEIAVDGGVINSVLLQLPRE